MAAVLLSQFIRLNQGEIVEEWAKVVTQRLGLTGLSEPLLINDLPGFLEDMAKCLDLPVESWADYEGARDHGRQRLELGVDIGQLVREFSLVGEVVVRVGKRHGAEVDAEQTQKLFHLTGAGAAASAREYAMLRDRQIEEQAADQFSFMAHEIRAPLHTARLAASLLRKQVGDTTENHRRMERAHARLSALVDNAILSARLYGQPRLHLEEQPLHQLAREVIDELLPQAENRGLTIEATLDHVQLSLDRKLIYSALVNLLGNAVKFTHPGGHIQFRLILGENSADVEIEDECGGISEEFPERLFQPFVQISSDKSGFGLGLMIVHQAASAHGGAVSVHNLPGKGCCFRFSLPLVIEQ